MPDLSLNQYHLLHGPSRLVNALREAGWHCEAQLSPWTLEVLSECDVVYIDLVSADCPPFTVDEVLAIEEYVKKGGGLLIATDHTNCYFHNHVLGSLAARLDIELTTELLCDRAPHTTGLGNAWIVASSFREHSITRGLERVAFQSGGCVDSRYGIVHSSQKSWGDWANIPPYGASNGPGFYGDFQQQPIERTGPLAAAAAKEFGSGRIFVLGDQNCFGGVFLNFLDNRRFALQAMHWLAKRECSESLVMQNREKDRALVWCLENPMGEVTVFGNTADGGHYHFYAWMGKIADARATRKELFAADLLVVLDESKPVPHVTMEHMAQFLAQPTKKILVLDSPGLDAESSDFLRLSRGLIGGNREVHGNLNVVKWYNGTEPKLFICKNELGWENKQFPAPEVSMSVTQHAVCESLRRLLLELGVNDAKTQKRSKSWLEEKEE
ncbi:MAG: hypothetical protein MUC83_10750 [Pirellula sp.]|nr:hypothetical protein [Pirellula sp.]